MRLSKNFLNDYVDISDVNYHELAEKMVFAGNEYESINKMVEATNLVVGEVIECINHPKSDHLHICQVNIGEEIVQIVCGAPNVTKDIKVIVAKIGANLPGGITIKEANLAGELSQGMICSIEELGIENKFLTDDDKKGIHILSNDAIVGENPLKYLNLDDEVIDFELTANRADLLSILGMAYEVGAIYNKEVKEPEINIKESKTNVNDIYSLDIQTENCPIYLGKLVKNIEIKESPEFIKARLIASDIRPINNVVDISNYVMLEYGQPLHFFDADKLGNKVIVRMAKDNEEIVTLDNNTRILENTDIVIANEEGPVALAGVMGGLSTEVESDTKNIFIESAIFKSSCIRNTSKKILKSEASSRYEKGIDPNRTEQAINRAAYLLQKYANGTVLSGIVSHDNINKEAKKIEITLDKINKVLGMNLKLETVLDTFKRLNFIYNVKDDIITVIVPTRRLDINIKEDLIEEIGRIVGYENVEGILPSVSMKQGKISDMNNYVKNIKNRLSSLGLNEVITYSLTSQENVNKFTDKVYESVYVESPMSEDKKVMRHSLIPSLLNVFDYNFARGIKNISIYETGSNYYIEDSYVEENRVAGLLFGDYIVNPWQSNKVCVDFYVVKGIIENLLNYLGLNGRYHFSSSNVLSDLHPGMSASIIVDNEIVGYLGKVHPSIHKKDIFVFEISIDKLKNKKVRNIKYKEISKYPTVNKDLAFIVKKEIESEEIMKIIKKVGGRLLSNIEVFDVYTGENVLEDEKSVAFSLVFQDMNRTLNDEEVTEIFNKIINEVETKLNATLRNK